ncbi:hypothetical protein [Arenimonas metalli]|uniref:Uncharacterized protein n=1 Tax=Arenimonas metalli CF5-1 TaxID=1384056 RepID=A0A091B4C1_9GAMM|nr:hypothetical protein [Arenimonas metalli]KFN46551.1 hypothetical protein N787_09995 [Arenimonas metalli CF5-1]
MSSDATAANPLLDRIVAFLRGIGITVREAELDDDAFLPGVRVADGALLFDRARLRWPGDLLHEAGHLAVLPPGLRAAMSNDLAGHDDVPHAGEIEATAWAYAATVAIGLAPAVLFHEGGYHGKSASLAMTYSIGVFPGVHGLVQAGMTASGTEAAQRGETTYPAMQRWLRQ